MSTMTEMELFIELLDDKEASNIIKKFKDPVLGYSKREPTLERKKMHIKQIFKRQTPRTRQARSGADLFFSYIHEAYDLKNMHSSSFEEFLEVATTVEEADMPDYKVFALSVLRYPQDIKEMMPVLVQNFKEGKPLFGKMQSFMSDEEVRCFYKERGMFLINEKNKILINAIESLLPKLLTKQLVELQEKVRSFSLVQFHEARKTLRRGFPSFLIDFAYVKTHPEEDDDIVQVFCINTLVSIAQGQKEAVNDLEIEVQKYKKIEIEVEKLRRDTTGYIDELARKNEKYKVSQKKVQQLSKRVTELENNIQQMEKNLTEELEKNRKEAEKIQREYQVQIKDMYKKQKNMERLFLNQESEKYPEFAVVYTMGGEIFDMFFPEIRAISIKQWEKHKKNIAKEDIKKIYIQRDGIPSSKYLDVVEFADKNRIEKHAFFASTPKKLLEIIGHLKFENREVVYDNY